MNMPVGSDRDLKFRLWWVTHRAAAKRIGLILFVVFDILWGGYIFSRLGPLLWQWKRMSSLPGEIARPQIPFKDLKRRYAPQPINIRMTKVLPFPTTSLTRLLVAEIQNPNDRWAIPSFSGFFTIGGKRLDNMESFLLPQERRFLIQAFRGEEDAPTMQSSFGIDRVVWRRVDALEKLPEVDFEFQNIEHRLIPLEDSASRSALSTYVRADITNRGPRNFREVTFLLLFWRQEELIFVEKTTMEKFRSLETRALAVSIGEPISGLTNVTIVPEINVLDPDSFF